MIHSSFLREQAYRRDVPDAEVHFFDTGHFALETHAKEIGAKIVDFLGRKLKRLEKTAA
jgi:hypothetical protein